MDVRQLLPSRDLALVAFAGPVAELPPLAATAEQLRAMVADARMPRKVARTADPLVVLEYAATIGPATAAAVHTQLARLETGVVASAVLTPGVADALRTLAASGTKTVVVSSLAPDAIRSFVWLAGLDVWRVIGRGGPDRSVLPPAPHLLTDAMCGRAVEDCAFVAGTAADVAAGRAAGVGTYRYRRPAEQVDIPWFEALSPVT